MARDYTAVPWEYLDEMEELTDEEFGRLIRSLLKYSQSGEGISPSGNERFYVKRVMNREDRFRQSFEEQSTALSERGKAGATARWSNAKACKSMPKHTKASQAMQDDAKHGNTETETDTDTDSNNTPHTPQRGEAFEKFWTEYPKKVGKQAAYKAWSRLKPNKELTQAILTAVESQKGADTWQKENGRFIPNPATWLNQGRWEDEPVSISQPAEIDEGDLDWYLERRAGDA